MEGDKKGWDKKGDAIMTKNIYRFGIFGCVSVKIK
jgi:hypothetical protein